MTTDLLPPPGKFESARQIKDAKFAAKMARRRKLLLLWSAPVVLIFFLASLKLLSGVGINVVGTRAYSQQHYVTAAHRYSALDFFNVVESWKAPFDEGTATYATGDFFAATTILKDAFSLVPKAPDGEKRGVEECMVRTNYSLALEGLADEAMAAKDYGTAKDYFDQAQQMLSDCGEDGGNGSQESQDAEQRQQQGQGESEQKQKDEQNKGDGDNSDQKNDSNDQSDQDKQDNKDKSDQNDQDNDKSDQDKQDPSDQSSQDGNKQSPSPSIDPKQKELQDRNREADRSREAEEQEGGGGNGSGQNW